MTNTRTKLAVLAAAVALAALLPAPAKGQDAVPPDFAIQSIAVDPAAPYANSRLEVRVEVRNAGRERVDNVQIVVNFSALFVGQSTWTSLAAGESTVLISQHSDPAPGTYMIEARLSLGGSAYGLEENKANNVKAFTFTVREGREPGTNADLALEGVKIVTGRGGQRLIEASVQNIGSDPAKCAFDVSLKTEVTKGTRRVMEREDLVIPAGQPFAPGAVKKMKPIPIVDKDHPRSLPDGTYIVRLSVRNTAGSFMGETDSANNYAKTSLTVGRRGPEPAPDFAIKSITLAPAAPYANSDLKLRVEVQNVGRERVDGVQIVVNFDNLFAGLSETTSLAPKAVKVLTAQKFHPAPGPYDIKARLSLGGSAYGLERNTANNTRSVAFTVREGREPGTNADLALEDVKIGLSGARHRIEATVRNVGKDPAQCAYGIHLVTEVTRGTRQVMRREDLVLPAGHKLSPGAAKKMGPIPIADKDRPDGRLADGAYVVKLSVRNLHGTYMEETDTANNHHQETYVVEPRRVTRIPLAAAARLKVPIGPVPLGFFGPVSEEVRAGEEVVLRWSMPDAAEVSLVGDRRTALELPAGEMRVTPACDAAGAPFCYVTYRVVGKTRDGAEFEREVRVKVNRR